MTSVELPRARTQAHPRLRLLALALVGLLLALAAAYSGISVYAASVLTGGGHSRTLPAPESIWPTHADVAFSSRIDHIPLAGWLFRAGSGDGRSAILMSGRQSNRVDETYGTASIARALLQHGYDVLLFDQRTTGRSGGSRQTLGTKEPRDLLGAYDFLQQQGYAPAKMLIIGDSMGGAAMLEAAPQLSAVGALVADSAFARLRPVLEAQLPPNSHLPAFFNWGIITAGRLLFGINPDLAPIDVVRHLPERAFLFIQGSADKTVPPGDAAELGRASANAQSRVLIVPGAAHVKSYATDPARYLQTLLAFADQQIAAHAGAAASVRSATRPTSAA